MKLTRKVIIEKQSEFWKYQHPDDVPEKLWIKSFKEIKQIKPTKEFCEFFMGEILLPLLKEKEYLKLYDYTPVFNRSMPTEYI